MGSLGDEIRAAQSGDNPDVERWLVIAAVAKTLDADYRRLSEPRDDRGVPVHPGSVNHLRGADVEDIVPQLSDPSLARDFASWRAAVSDMEASNARRLSVLSWCARALTEMRARSTAPEKVDKMTFLFADWIAKEWSTDVPLTGDLRAWTSRATRRYDLLPRAWRGLHR